MPAKSKSAASTKDSTAAIGFGWFGKDDNVRWQPSGARQTAKGNPQGERGGVHQFGVPHKSNANFARMQHFIYHLAPHGMAGFVLANGSMEQVGNSF